MTDEGYIKFHCEWEKSSIAINSVYLEKLNHFRNLLIEKQMIGKIPDGPGFGNISFKAQKGFVISGSNTGHLNELLKKDLALVQNVDIVKNNLSCIGETIASSESMTHAVIYEHTNAKVVIHIHHKELWNNLLYKIPTTDNKISYGTPEMAFAIQELLRQKNSKIFVLGGHEDGIIAYGSDFEESFAILMDFYYKFC